MEVAISVAGEIVNLYQSEQKARAEQNQALEVDSTQLKSKSVPASQKGIFWKEFKELINAD
jgi:hypothetical protein